MPPETRTPDDPRVWIGRARSNLVQAKTLQPGVYPEDLCGWVQQAAEKALKALLPARESSFPYTHDLARLLGLIAERIEGAPERIREAARLTDYAVEAHYPGVSKPEWISCQAVISSAETERPGTFGDCAFWPERVFATVS